MSLALNNWALINKGIHILLFFLFLHKNIKTGLLNWGGICGKTQPHRWRRETWWWNEHVEKAIAAKRTAFKAWKAGKGTRASYDAAKRNARHAVHHARQKADKKVNENIDPKSSEVYRLANRFRRENTDVVGDKPVRDVNEGRLKAEGLARVLPKASQRWVWLGPRPRVISTTTGPIRHSGGDDTSRRWHGRLHDPWPRSCNHLWWQGTRWLGAEFLCLPLQGKNGCIGKRQLPWSQADRAGYENPGEDCGQPHQTAGVNRQFPVWLRPRQRHYRRNLCCQAAAREVSSCQ